MGMYKVKFQDGHRASLAANAIAENLFAQIDDEGNRHILFHRLPYKWQAGPPTGCLHHQSIVRSRTETGNDDRLGATSSMEGW